MLKSTMNDRLSPREFALVLLAAESDPPRQRARDQRADLTGLGLRRQVLQRLATLDPEPDQFEAALTQIVNELQGPSGPSRAVAMGLRDELLAVCTNPDLLEHWLREALNSGGKTNRRKRGSGDRN